MRHVLLILSLTFLVYALTASPPRSSDPEVALFLFLLVSFFGYAVPWTFRLIDWGLGKLGQVFQRPTGGSFAARSTPAGGSTPRPRWQPRSGRDLDALRWDEVERVLEAAYARWGWKVERTGTSSGARVGRHGGDGGVDLVLRRAGDLCLVSSKHWKGRVGVKEVRELFGLMAHHGATRGVVVGTGGFTDEAWRFVKGKPIDLVSGKKLDELLAGPAATATG
jgi:hypothetical protein